MGEDKRNADLAMPGKGDMDALPLDPGGDMGSCRLAQEDAEKIASSSHLDLDHLEGDIEDVEVPWGPPFAPCSKPRRVIQRPRDVFDSGQEATEANENW